MGAIWIAWVDMGEYMSCYGWAWMDMGGHMPCYGWAWVGIGRCWWVWSRYGYKFEGKCWALWAWCVVHMDEVSSIVHPAGEGLKGFLHLPGCVQKWQVTSHRWMYWDSSIFKWCDVVGGGWKYPLLTYTDRVQLGWPTQIYRHFILIWIFTIIVTKYKKYYLVVVDIRLITYNYKFLVIWFWVEVSCICIKSTWLHISM